MLRCNITDDRSWDFHAIGVEDARRPDGARAPEDRKAPAGRKAPDGLYKMKEELREAKDDPPASLVRALREHGHRLLAERTVERYERLEVGNGRLRSLMEDMVEPGQWRLLWTHPSLPYTEPAGAYAEVPDFTKALVFSSWTVVPDAISATCSYEVERRIVERAGLATEYQELYRAQRPLLRFTESRGRLTGMPTLALMYPSIALSQAVDPLRIAFEQGGEGDGRPVPPEAARRVAATRIDALLRASGSWPREGDGLADQRWYWAALAILDRRHLTGMRRWLSSKSGWQTDLGGEEDTWLPRHIELFRDAAEGTLEDELGPAPDDLVEVLVELALGSPAVCAMRALDRIAPGLEPVANAPRRL